MNRKTGLIQWFSGFLPVFLFIVSWEIVGRFNLFPGQFFFPPFSAVVKEG